MTTTSLITAGGYKMLVRSITLAMVMFIPTNFAGREQPARTAHFTTIFRDPSPIIWDSPQIRPRSPGAIVWDIPKDITDRIEPEIAAVIIPRAKPERPSKPVVKINNAARKCWRDRKGGYKSYRLRRVCRAGERTRP